MEDESRGHNAAPATDVVALNKEWARSLFGFTVEGILPFMRSSGGRSEAGKKAAAKRNTIGTRLVQR